MNLDDIKDLLLENSKGRGRYFFYEVVKEWVEKQSQQPVDTPPEAPKLPSKRTNAQNAAMHLWLSQVAAELDKEGFTLQNVVAEIKQAEIRPTGKNLKEAMWRPYQLAATGKASSAQLDKQEVDRVYEGLNKFLGEHFHIHVPFPSEDKNVKLAQHENTHTTTYKHGADPNPPKPLL